MLNDRSASDICQNCQTGQSAIDSQTGERYCSNCGFVLAPPPMIDSRLSQRDDDYHMPSATPASEYVKPKVGSARMAGHFDTNRHPIPKNTRWEIHRMEMTERWAEAHSRKVSVPRSVITGYALKVGLTPVLAEDSWRLYVKWRSSNPRQGSVRTISCVAAVLILVGRQYGIPLSVNDVSMSLGVKSGEVWDALKRIRKQSQTFSLNTLNVLTPEQWIESIGAKLNIERRLIAEAKALISGYSRQSGKPSCFGAGALMAALRSNDRATPNIGEVADACGVSEVSVRIAMKSVGWYANVDVTNSRTRRQTIR